MYKANNKPVLLIIGPTPPPHHGVSISIAALLQSQINKSFKVFHVDLADRRGIEHVNKPDFHDVILFLKQWIMTVRILVLKNPKIVYLAISQTAVGFLRDSLFLFPSYLRGAKIVLHLHGGNLKTWYSKQALLIKKIVQVLIKKASGAIVLGESLRYNFEPFLESGKIYVIPNGLDIDQGVPKSSVSSKETIPDLRSPHFRIIHLSTLSRRKGSLSLIEAIPRVTACRKDVEFIFAGPWADLKEKKWAFDFIKKTGISRSVFLTGPVHGKAKFALLRSCDLFVFPGVQQEGQPLVVLEAMAAGLPVLYTNRGCLSETVINGETGVEFDFKNPEELANKILWMLGHEDEIKLMGKAGRLRYESMFTLEHHAKRMLNVLKAIAA